MNQGRIIRLIIASLNTVFILSFIAYKVFEFQDAKALVLAYEDIALPNIFINDLDVSNLNRDEIKAMIDDQIKQYKERKIIVHVGEKDFETTPPAPDFKIQFIDDALLPIMPAANIKGFLNSTPQIFVFNI